MIRKEGNKWVIYSKDGKKLSEHDTKKEAEKRERQIKFFKYRDGK